VTTYSSSYKGVQWRIVRITLDPETTLTEPREIAGPTAYWPDGTTSYVLHFNGGHIAWTVAEEADTALAAVDAIRSGEEISKELLRAYLRGVRSLEARMTALKEELLLYARETGPDGKTRLTFQDLGIALGQHRSTVAERHQRILDGHPAERRHWLTHETDRAATRHHLAHTPIDQEGT
jgi:hypothetical protein